jgi:hypothetical protein
MKQTRTLIFLAISKELVHKLLMRWKLTWWDNIKVIAPKEKSSEKWGQPGYNE